METLTAGPRGRRLCYELASGVCAGTVDGATLAAPWTLRGQLEHAVAHVAGLPESAFLEAFGRTVNSAMSWQAPDDDDVALADPRLDDVLGCLAAAVDAHPATAWWRDGIDVAQQHYVRELDRPVPEDLPPLTDVAGWLQRWREQIVEENRRGRQEARRHRGRVRVSGPWWSIPQTLVTSAPGFGLPALGVKIVEDGMDPERVALTRFAVDPDARVYEVREAEDWAGLVAAYPLDVTHARMADWERATGRLGRWFLPDWTAVATEYDAVHVTLRGYLSTAGRVLEVPGGATLLAGWDPGSTSWLTDALRVEGDLVAWEWVEDDSIMGHWRRSTGSAGS